MDALFAFGRARCLVALSWGLVEYVLLALGRDLVEDVLLALGWGLVEYVSLALGRGLVEDTF